MSYTPDEQNIQRPGHALLAAISEFNAAVDERVKHHDEWTDAHLEKITEVAAELTAVRLKVAKLL